MMSDCHEHDEKAWSERPPSRQAFLLAAACGCGALSLGLAHKSLFAAAAPGEVPSAPATVSIIDFGPDGKKLGKKVLPRLMKTNDEWKHQLSAGSYEVAREAGTEPAYSGVSWDEHSKGIFRCIGCDLALFASETKFDSGTGWPSFWKPIAQENIVKASDSGFGMMRTAVSCRECNAHLGHVFNDGPRPTGMRYCMNSASMRFVKLA